MTDQQIQSIITEMQKVEEKLTKFISTHETDETLRPTVIRLIRQLDNLADYFYN